MAKKKGISKLRKKEKFASSKKDNPSSDEDERSKKSSHQDKNYEVDGDDDESINDDGSEIGWNSDDEATYGQLFKKKSTEDDEEESNFEDEEDMAGEGILLSDMLSSSAPTQNVNQPSEENSLESDQDENEDSDDQYAYDDEDDDEHNHDQLLAAIEKYSKSDQQPKTPSKSNSKIFQFSTESPFSTFQGNQTISLDTLINSLEQQSKAGGSIDQETLKHIKSNLTSLNSSINAPKYMSKVHSDRAERGITYQNTTSEMGKWQNIIAENKAQKSLDLRQDKRSVPSTKSMITSYQPQTDMEKEIQMILLKTTKETDIEKNEEDELLHSKELTHEEIREKQRELAKIKSMLFYEQMKRHRINKIKSKTFHRILKKKKLKKQISAKEYNEAIQKLKNNGDILDEDLEEDENGKETEEETIRRIKERMNLRHKNTGKWARMALEHGKGSKSLREAYHEAVLLGNELTKKATTLNENEDPYEENIPRRRTVDEDDDEGRQSKKLRIVDEASESLENILDTGSKETELNGKYKALFEMDFMKKAREQQQLRAKEEAQQLLREIEQMEEGLSESESEEQVDPQEIEKHNKLKQDMLRERKEKLEQAKKQITNLMNGNNSMSLTSTSTVAESGSAIVQNNPWLDPSVASKVRDLNAIIGESNSVKNQKSKKKNKNAVTKSDNAATISLENVDELETTSTTTKPKKLTKKTGSTTPMTPILEEKNHNTKSETTRKPLLMQKSQQDLVNLAFAGPDYEADFEALKDKIIDEELNISDKKRKILSDDKAGWGDWAGPGMIGVSQRVVQKRQRLLKNLDEKKAELKAGRKDSALANVILSEKRIKTTAKYKLSDIPHPFTSREEYERSLQMPVGNEWNAEHIVRKNTKPEVMLRAGRIIEPIQLPKQRKSNAMNKK